MLARKALRASQLPNVFKGISMNPKIELTSVMQALKVAEHLSFRRAAEALGVCQSSVSKRVRALENLLGVDLFDRHHAGVKVTNAGRHFFERIKMALDHLDSAVTSAGRAGRVEKGSLKIGLFSSLARILAGTAAMLFGPTPRGRREHRRRTAQRKSGFASCRTA
jgi:DNA-binding transcriptional LysR family regulator